MSTSQTQQVSNGAKPERPAHNNSTTSDSQAKLSAHSKKPQKKSEPKPPDDDRDLITGRRFVEDGESCLRCIEKGLRCTLNFLGVNGEDKCSACRRSNSQYCCRQRPLANRAKWAGPPWKNPNYFTVGKQPTPGEMVEILRDHYLGQETYRFGEYMYDIQRSQFALPPFNGSYLPLEERPENWKSMDWKRVLPVWKNRSLHPEPGMEDSKEEPEDTQQDPLGHSDDTAKYMRHTRKYEPRKEHLNEHLTDLGETW